MWSFDPWHPSEITPAGPRRWSAPRTLRLGALVGVLVLGGCTEAPHSKSGPAEADPTSPRGVVASALAGPPQVLATVGGETILLDDVAQDVAMQVWRRQVDIYSLLKREAERVAEDRIVEAEAARRGLTREALLRTEVEEAVQPVTEAEVDAWLAEHPREAAMGEVARPRVAFFLGERRRQERRLAFLDGLRDAAGFELRLEPPVRPRVQPDVDGAPARGAPEADVDLVYFGMPSTAAGAKTADWIAEAMERHPDRIRLIHRPFLAMEDEVGLAAALIGYRAQASGRYWEWYEGLRARKDGLDAAGLLEVAEQAGLERARVEADLRDQTGLARLKADITAGLEAGVDSPPVVFVDGNYFNATYGHEAFVAQVDAALSSAGAGAR